MVSTRHACRGQLILVGAIIVATIIFGLSLLLNSVLFTGAAGQNGVSADLSDTGQIDFEVKRGVRSTILRVNHRGRNVTDDDVGTDVRNNVTLYSRLFGESRAASMPASVNVTYDNESSSIGYRIVQDRDGPFTDAGDGRNWYPVPLGSDAQVGWVNFNLELSNTTADSLDPATITASTGPAGDQIVYDLYDSGGNITVETTVDPAAGPSTSHSVKCGHDNDRVLLDLYAGGAFTDDCTFPAIGNLSGPISLQVEDGDLLEGKYEIVMNESNTNVGSSNTYRRCVDSSGDGRPPSEADPCVAPTVWTANVTTTVIGDSIQYDNTYDLSIYGGRK